MQSNSLFIIATLTCMLCILLQWTPAQTIQSTAGQQQCSEITSNSVLMDALGPTMIRVAWWTEDASLVSRYSVLCSESLASKLQNNTVVTDIEYMQSVTVLNFTNKSINSVRVSRLLPHTNYRCCLVQYNINNNFTAEVCRNAITLLQINCGPPVSDSVGCPNNNHVGSIASLFVMLLLAFLCTLLLVLLVIKQGRNGEKITHWFEQVKNENESLKQRVIDTSDDSVTEEASMEERHQNSAVDNTEEGISHSSMFTSACVAYHCVADRNPSQASDSDSVVYAVPFDTA